MKAFCINENGWVEERGLFFLRLGQPRPCDGPKYGDIVTITGDLWKKGIHYYYLEEWPPRDREDAFDAAYFIPIQEETTEPALTEELVTDGTLS